MPGRDYKNIKHVLISRVDAIGDVVLTLPVCGYLKQLLPGVKISFLGKSYTQPVIESCDSVDEFLNYDEIRHLKVTEQVKYLSSKHIDAVIYVFPDKQIAKLAKKAGIYTRIGTTNRFYHWFTCNKLVKLSRRNSNLHESQLNLKLLEPFGLNTVPQLPDIACHYNFKAKADLTVQIKSVLIPAKFNLILHPKSHGSGSEWGLSKFTELINILPKNQFNVIVTGSNHEKGLLKEWLDGNQDSIIDMTGKLTLAELIAFIASADGLVAAGTGPLHIAAASGIFTLGLFPCLRPIHPGRWAPVGLKAEYIESDSATLSNISPVTVYDHLQKWLA